MLDLNLCRPLQPHEDQQSFSGLAHELAESRICKRQKTGGSHMAFVSGSVTVQTWQEEREAKHQVALLRWLEAPGRIAMLAGYNQTMGA